MSTSITTTVVIEGSSKAETASFVCDAATNKRKGSITMTHNGVTLTFGSVADYTTFLNDIIIPLTNRVHDIPGTATTPYEPATPGVASPAALQD